MLRTHVDQSVLTRVSNGRKIGLRGIADVMEMSESCQRSVARSRAVSTRFRAHRELKQMVWNREAGTASVRRPSRAARVDARSPGAGSLGTECRRGELTIGGTWRCALTLRSGR